MRIVTLIVVVMITTMMTMLTMNGDFADVYHANGADDDAFDGDGDDDA